MNKRVKKQIKEKINNIQKKSGFTPEELSLISNTFYEKDELLITIRKHFLQIELNEQDLSLLKTLTPETRVVLKRQILPEIDPYAEWYKVKDVWTQVDTHSKLVEDSCLDMKAWKIAVDYLEQRFDCLEKSTETLTHIQLKDLVYNERKDDKTAFTELKARNTLLVHIDANLENIRALAIINADITDEDKTKQLDSNK